jgi:ATP diphosphatase
MENTMTQIDRLLGIMKRLRDPENGCPWDKEQTFATIAPYTLEETYEVLDAISREDFDDLRGELGDLLFQVVFYAQMAQEEGRFNFDDICAAISDKLERRHPHIFGDATAGTARSAGPLGADQKRRAGKIPALRAGRYSAEPARADARA